MQQGCPQPHEEVPSALETLLLESTSYIASILMLIADKLLKLDMRNFLHV
jgi:hypothetical protein